MSQNSDEIRTRVLTENTAQSVLNHLKALESNRTRMRTRWIWELLQNARDTSTNADTRLVASVKHEPGELVFQHNGARFKMDQIAHLIYHGSTKAEDEGTIGQYGSGFLTTHLLSPEIDVSGQLDDGRSFAFRLKREVGSVEELSESMERAWNDFNNSLSDISTSDEFTTQFRYPLIEDTAVVTVKDGLKTLGQCAPFVILFNQEFSSIDVKAFGETISYKSGEKSELPQENLWKILVTENENGNENKRTYLLSESEKVSVAVPIESTDNNQRCLPVGKVPRIFLGFPLVGTENFSFPAVINSLGFTPTEDRDGVYLGQSDNDANRENQLIIQNACELLVNLLKFSAESSWCNTYELANVPTIHEQNWLNPDWIRDNLKAQLIKNIRQTPAVINEAGNARVPEAATLPLAEIDTGVKALWALLGGLEKVRDTLPRRDEAIGWWRNVKSWADVYEDDPISLFDEVMDGQKLASDIDEKARVEDLQDLLQANIDAVEWLDQLHGFFNKNGLREAVREYHIVLDQDGYLDELSDLHRDQGIDEELKDIAELLNWEIRQDLRDTQLSSLTDEVGKGDWDNEYVVGELIKKLQKYADEDSEEDPDDSFKQASVRLFAWIVGQKDWSLLRGFPVFAEETDSDSRSTIIKLERTENEEERPLAPIQSWAADLQPYSELFPRRCIIANAFFDAVPHLDVWQMLEKQDFLKRDVIITRNVRFKTFLPDEPLTEEEEHEASEDIEVTNIAFLTKDDIGIMDRVRQSQRLARTFWHFLTEWLIVHDAKGLEIDTVLCECKKKHRYYPAEWLVPLVRNRWVPLGNRRADRATAKSLGSLLSGSEWETNSLRENPEIAKLLEAIGVRSSDLMLEIVAADAPENRVSLESTITDMLAATEGDLSSVRQFLQDMEEDENLPDILEERRKRRRTVRANQCLGRQVEELVKESLKSDDFSVHRVHIGADFEIEYDLVESDEEIGLEIGRNGRKWLIEVKATRGQEIRMSSKQAKTAVEKQGRFLLCVVPVGSGNLEPDLYTVRANMRFIKNMGDRVRQLCNNLDNLENVRSGINKNASSGVQLVVESGTARISVASSVWENDGFQLENLASYLK